LFAGELEVVQFRVAGQIEARGTGRGRIQAELSARASFRFGLQPLGRGQFRTGDYIVAILAHRTRFGAILAGGVRQAPQQRIPFVGDFLSIAQSEDLNINVIVKCIKFNFKKIFHLRQLLPESIVIASC
jgi:hypothetical protein